VKAADPSWLPRYAGFVFRTSLSDSRLAALFAHGTLLVPIPRSIPWDGEVLWPALELAIALRDVGLALPVWTGLQREFGVQKSATAPNGRRPSVEQHYESFSVPSSAAPLHRLLLVDDIITKGRTLLAAAARLQAQMPHADIRAFALIRTQGFVRCMDQVTDVCHGAVRWAGGDARREP
jgi:hypothetical protein